EPGLMERWPGRQWFNRHQHRIVKWSKVTHQVDGDALDATCQGHVVDDYGQSMPVHGTISEVEMRMRKQCGVSRRRIVAAKAGPSLISDGPPAVSGRGSARALVTCRRSSPRPRCSPR